MKLALTGATGFVGGHVLRQALEASHEVRALTRSPQPARAGVEWVGGSLEDAAALRSLCVSADAVIHVAGVVNGGKGAFDRGNRLGTLTVLDAAAKEAVKRFVHVSSLAAREPALSQYGASKRAGEDAVTASTRDWCIVRPPAVYGPGDTENLELFRLAKRGLVPLPPAGRLSLIHAGDLARLIVTLVEPEAPRTILEPDDGVAGGWSHRDYAAAIAATVGRRAIGLPMPATLVRAAARLDGLVRGEKAKLTADRAAYFCHPDWVADPARRPDPTVWTPRIDTRSGLAETARWYQEKGWL